MMKSNWKINMLCGLLMLAGHAQAAPTPCAGGTLSCYIGLDVGSTDPTVNPATNTPRTNANAANAAFLSSLDSTGIKRDGFETATVGGTPLLSPLGLDGFSAVDQVGNGAIAQIKDSSQATTSAGSTEYFGRFNTTAGGSKWWETSYDFSFTFLNAVSAFGFYATDVGDFDGSLNLALSVADGSTLKLENLVPTSTRANGSLLFFGFTDSARKFTGVAFNIVQAASAPADFDAIGFDDMTTGNLAAPNPEPNPAPEPTSLALTGLALAGLAASRRRKKA